MLENFILGASVVFTIEGLLAVVIGTAAGIVIGALPGLGPSLGVALLIPVTFGLDPSVSLIMLVSLYLAAEYGGSISAILIGTPGTAAATATVVDGYPLNLKGQPGKALGASLTASTVGGIVGGLALMLFSQPLAAFALSFGAPEYFALGVFGLAIVASLSGNAPLKGLLMALLGLAFTAIGVDPVSGTARYTFDSFMLYEGIHFLVALIGLFALGEVFSLMERSELGQKMRKISVKGFITLPEFVRLIPTYFRGSVIGAVVGTVPGAGANIAGWIAYDQEKRWARNKENFGNGDIRGVAAPESANSATVGGALIPLLTLGLPGSPTTAVLIGALIIHGLQPGPELFVQNADVVYGLFVGLIVSYFVLLLLGILAMPLWMRIIQVPGIIMAPIIFALATIGAYSVRNLVFDVWIALAFGVLGYVLKTFRFPLAPLVLAMVLGTLIESNFRRSMIMSQGDPMIFLQRPMSVGFIVLGIVSFVIPLIQNYRQWRRETAAAQNVSR